MSTDNQQDLLATHVPGKLFFVPNYNEDNNIPQAHHAFALPENLIPITLPSGGFALVPMDEASALKLVPSPRRDNQSDSIVLEDSHSGSIHAFQIDGNTEYMFITGSATPEEIGSLIKKNQMDSPNESMRTEGPPSIASSRYRSRTSSAESLSVTLASMSNTIEQSNGKKPVTNVKLDQQQIQSPSDSAITPQSSPSNNKISKTPSLESLARFMCRADAKTEHDQSGSISNDEGESLDTVAPFPNSNHDMPSPRTAGTLQRRSYSASDALNSPDEDEEDEIPRMRSLSKQSRSEHEYDAKRKRSRLDENERMVRTSLFRGVGQCGKDRKFQSRIRYGARVRYLGRYSTEIEAALVYDSYARQLRGPDAPTNFIEMNEDTQNDLKLAFIENGFRIPDSHKHLVSSNIRKQLTSSPEKSDEHEEEAHTLVDMQRPRKNYKIAKQASHSDTSSSV